MSYSRWSNSCFYTFWCASKATCRDEEIFDVCAVKSFTYKELVDDIDACITDIKNIETDHTEEELKELKGYMLEFIEDVKEEYNTPSQKYRDGEITLDEAFIEEI